MKTSELAAKIHYGLARDADVQGVSRSEILAIKSDPDSMNYRFVPGFRGKAATATQEVVIHDASTEDVDSMGDRISVFGTKGGKGWDLRAFRDNPMLLWSHQSGGPGLAGQSIAKPLGLVVGIVRGKNAAGDAPALVSKSRFHDRSLFGNDSWGDHAEAVKNLVMAGAMPGSSVGFLIRKVHEPTSEDECSKLGIGPCGLMITEAELRELSIVPIPANPRAITRKSIEAIRSTRDRILTGMAQERGLGEKWMREFNEIFPTTEDDWRELEAKCRRRSVQVHETKETQEFVRVPDETRASASEGEQPATSQLTEDSAQLIADTMSDVADELRRCREFNEQLSGVLDDLRIAIQGRNDPELASLPPKLIKPKVAERSVYDELDDILSGVTDAVRASAANSNGAIQE